MANWAWVFVANLKGPKGDTGATGPAFGYKGSLANNTDLNTLVAAADTGHYTLSTANTYTNMPPNTPGIGGMLQVITSGFNDTRHIVTWRSGGGVYERQQTSAGVFSAWRRTDRAADDALWARVNAIDGANSGANWFAMRDRGTLATVDLNTLNTKTSVGYYILNTTNIYTNAPVSSGVANPTAGMLEVTATSVGDAVQVVTYRFGGGTYERAQAGPTTWTAWRRTDRLDDSVYTRLAPMDRFDNELQSQIRMAYFLQLARTGYEITSRWSTRTQGDLYLDKLLHDFPTKLTARTLGNSQYGYPIRAAHMGNPAGQTFMIMAGQHGDEVASREAVLIWLREMLESTDPALATWLTNNCILVIPCVNVDMIGVQRHTVNDSDLNRNWVTRSTPEVFAAASVFDLYNVLLCIDAHEGGGTTMMKIDVSPSPEVHNDIKAMNTSLYNAVWDAFVAAGKPIGQYTATSTELTWAMNQIPAVEHAAALLLESPSLLMPNMYSPDPMMRIDTHLLSFRTAFTHFQANQAAYASAKAAAGG